MDFRRKRRSDLGMPLLRGISWALEALREREKGSTALERLGAAQRGSLAQELCKEERRMNKN